MRAPTVGEGSRWGATKRHARYSRSNGSIRLSQFHPVKVRSAGGHTAHQHAPSMTTPRRRATNLAGVTDFGEDRAPVSGGSSAPPSKNVPFRFQVGPPSRWDRRGWALARARHDRLQGRRETVARHLNQSRCPPTALAAQCRATGPTRSRKHIRQNIAPHRNIVGPRLNPRSRKIPRDRSTSTSGARCRRSVASPQRVAPLRPSSPPA